MQSQIPTRFLSAALLTAVVTALPFLLGIGGGFIFDDRQTIQLNDALRDAWRGGDSILYAIYSYYGGHGSRALAMFTFALDSWRGGMDPAVFKSTNIAIHAITTAVLAAFLNLLFLLGGWSRPRAAAAALTMAALWALHPLQVSAVLYIVQRMQTLGTLFLLSALWAYMKMRQAQLAGDHSRRFAALTALFWGLGFASKEDCALLPLYTLALELTVLRFQSAQPAITNRLRRSYAAFVAFAALAYVLVIVPHYWHADAYPGRDFSSYERLLTQARVLAMYLGQILLPLPSRLPFYYDDLTPSRGLLDPTTTLLALMLVIGLLATAWALRQRRPLFAFGVMLFFGGHFLTSNVLNLELAFEHRNHFPLVGALIALADVFVAACERWAIRSRAIRAAAAAILAAAAAGTAVRAYEWGEPTRFAEQEVRLAPNSARAWTELCTHYFDLNSATGDNAYIDKAIDTCERGAARTGSPLLLYDVIVYKALKGESASAYWPAFVQKLRDAPANAEMMGIYYALLRNVATDLPADTNGTLQALSIIADRAPLSPGDYIAIGVYVFNNSSEPEAALPYLERAVRMAPPDSPMIAKMFRDLAAAGHEDWVDHLRTIAPPPRAKASAG